MKFTSGDLLKAMGLKVGDELLMNGRKAKIVKDDAFGNCISFEGTLWKIEWLIEHDFEIIKYKQKLSDAERVILENLPKDCCGWVTRDRDNILIVSEFKPVKYEKGKWHFENRNFEILPFEHLFQFITRGDEPYEIKELLK